MAPEGLPTVLDAFDQPDLETWVDGGRAGAAT